MTELERKILDELYGDIPSVWRHHAKNGFFVYESEEEYLESCKSCGMDENDAKDLFKYLDRVTVDGKTYFVDFVS